MLQGTDIQRKNISERIRLIAFDLDGTITQHKTHMTTEARNTLDALNARYRLCMIGAGSSVRIMHQMDEYPIDIIGNYGMQYLAYREGKREWVFDHRRECDRDSVERRVTQLREQYGYTMFQGDNVEFHESGCVTIPLLGTTACLPDKLAFDPDRRKRAVMYDYVTDLFPDYRVFIGGSSSFDMAPVPFDKAYALTEYCEKNGIPKEEVVYVGDDCGPGGNDESVLRAGYAFEKIEDYRTFPAVMRKYLE